MKKKDLVVLHMLYESGACSQRELHQVLAHLSGMIIGDDVSERIKYLYTQCLSYLEHVSSTPRRLVSMCRLVISHQLGVSKPRKRESRVQQLPLPDPMKDYVIFSDLVNPEFGKQILLDNLK